jgi:hypothetical protein
MNLIEELADQFLLQNEEFRSMLNVKTGEVLFEPMDPFEDESYDEDDEDVEYDDEFEMDEEVEVADELVIIPELSSPEAYNLREAYARQISEPAHRHGLLEALHQKKPFQQFGSQLQGMGLLDDWQRFEREYAKGQIMEWLKEEGLYARVMELDDAGHSE